MIFEIDKQGFEKAEKGEKTALVFPSTDIRSWLGPGYKIILRKQGTSERLVLFIESTRAVKAGEISSQDLEKLAFDMTKEEFVTYMKDTHNQYVSVPITESSYISIIRFNLLGKVVDEKQDKEENNDETPSDTSQTKRNKRGNSVSRKRDKT